MSIFLPNMVIVLSKLWPESCKQTDGRTVAIIIPPPNFVCGGGNKKQSKIHPIQTVLKADARTPIDGKYLLFYFYMLKKYVAMVQLTPYPTN